MNPVSHFLIGWLTANSIRLNRRERATVTLAGIAPDIDSLGIVAEKLTSHWEKPLLWWTDYHHVLAHNIGFGLLVTVIGFLIATQRWKTALFAFLSFHFHLLADLVGARGPEGYQWPIPYLSPFSHAWQLTWSGQWFIDAWPNFVITAVALILTFYLAWKRGYSPLKIFSSRADQAVIKTIHHRFPRK